jgi:Helix-hairpin-helix motif
VRTRWRTAVVGLGLVLGYVSLPCMAQTTASIEELMKVPGMTRTWAGRIVRFRPYRTKLDLLQRGIVSSEVYARIKDYVIAHREKQ